MKSHQTVTCTDPDALSEAILSRVGLRIRLGMPPGAGKANRVANALFKRAAADQRISLEIFTAFSLEIPEGKSELERRFVGPLADRLFTGYEELGYTRALRENNMPPNVKVSEFYFTPGAFTPGAWIGSLEAQRNYVSANYTDACRVKDSDRPPRLRTRSQISARLPPS